MRFKLPIVSHLQCFWPVSERAELYSEAVVSAQGLEVSEDKKVASEKGSRFQVTGDGKRQEEQNFKHRSRRGQELDPAPLVRRTHAVAA